MSILAWIEDQRKLKLLNAPKYNHPASDGSKGLWTRCDHCGVILYIKHLKENRRVCFGCGYHLQMNSHERIDHLIDAGTWRPLDETLSPCDPLEFWDQKPYIERLKESQERTGLQDAVQTGTGMLDGIPVALGVMDFYFMGGSMGSVVGEKITRLIEYATQEGLTLILVCASGGARMQEGVLSLMQMAKISAALHIYQSCANLLYISVVTSPTTGGVTASFAMLGDLIFAEPKALIGFAGRRVIEQTLQEQLPDDFQTAEYLLHHGLLDLIIPRSFFKPALFETITLYKDAPLKRSGIIPHGIQQNLNFITEEKIRKNWSDWKQKTKKSYPVSSGLPADLISKNQSDKAEKQQQISNKPNFVSQEIGSENNLEKLKFVYKKDPSESLYREILTNFESMFNFFALTPFIEDNSEKNNLFVENIFTEFISQFSSKNQTFTKKPSSSKIVDAGNKNDSELVLNKKISDFTSSETNILRIIEWRILYENQNNYSKTSFLETFVNGKHKNFFYKPLQPNMLTKV